MIKNRKPSPLNSAELLATIRGMLAHHHHDWGLLSLGGVLLALSLLAGVQMGQRPGIYLAGEIAAHDVVADRDMRVEDPQGTEARRAQATALQPLVFDLDKESVALFREDTLALLHAISMNMENTNLSIVPLALILSVLPWALQIIGMRFEIMTEVARWLPSSLANYSRILEEAGMVEKCWGVGIFWIAASSAVGILLYKKQEIR